MQLIYFFTILFLHMYDCLLPPLILLLVLLRCKFKIFILSFVTWLIIHLLFIAYSLLLSFKFHGKVCILVLLLSRPYLVFSGQIVFIILRWRSDLYSRNNSSVQQLWWLKKRHGKRFIASETTLLRDSDNRIELTKLDLGGWGEGTHRWKDSCGE